MPMEQHKWRGVEFRIATSLFPRPSVILNWNLPIRFGMHMDGVTTSYSKRCIPQELRTALDNYVASNGFAGMPVVEYLDKLFGPDYKPKVTYGHSTAASDAADSNK